jgi:ABC-type glutathione transport system ATPase component
MKLNSPAVAGKASRSTRDPELRSQSENQGQLQGQAETNPELIIQVEGLRKTYKTAHGFLDLFDNLDLKVVGGEMVAIVGQSGA